ncbi:nucleoside transporter C-terminal domain-containing protein [Novosphingobium sp.]|uniref:NupC/NupG family nucleoside CNT transporter n=1 Tax=Novosphingobium sp. TaxID=1874826 RepID=UPI0025D09BEE|nr:nucleoside transporter C-terminal domain-containing protein [Novosphingobium sp.]MCC6925929.1 NupC/NupG family nucleoside CNT transporter [Novosphingobium sp.]
MPNLISLAGIALIALLGVALSSNRKAIRLRVVAAAFALQAVIAVLALKVPAGRMVLEGMSSGFLKLLSYSEAGTQGVFGPLAEAPFKYSFAIGALPAIIFFAALVSILYYLGIMQLIIKWIGGGIRVITGVSRVESLGAAANIFVGQSESPLVIRPFLAGLTRSQLFLIMTVGFAGVAGTILAGYVSALGNDDAARALLPYLITASFMSAPGGILMAKLMQPDNPEDLGKEPEVEGEIQFGEEKPANIIMAAAEGAQTGVKLAVAVGAMVLAFVALMALLNGLIGGIGSLAGHPDLSFQQIVGWIFAPVMNLVGVPWSEAGQAGSLFGTKLVLNEFIAFGELKDLKATFSPIALAVTTIALCGFSNFSSIAIQMAVTGGLAPNQRPVIAKLGLKALAAGSLANLMSASLAGLVLSL